jgi:hypothetical protein
MTCVCAQGHARHPQGPGIRTFRAGPRGSHSRDAGQRPMRGRGTRPELYADERERFLAQGAGPQTALHGGWSEGGAWVEYVQPSIAPTR